MFKKKEDFIFINYYLFEEKIDFKKLQNDFLGN